MNGSGSAAATAATRRGAGRLAVYGVLTTVGLLAAVALRIPGLAVVVAPFALTLLVDAARGHGGDLGATLQVEAARVVEGETVRVTTALSSARTHHLVDLALEVTSPALAAPEPRSIVLRGDRVVEWEVPTRRWGAGTVGPLLVRSRSLFGLFTETRTLGEDVAVRVYPTSSQLRRLVRPVATQPSSGHQVARRGGQGIEFADLRPFAAGDRVRDVNWKETARRREPWVTVRRPEHNVDIVLLLDEYNAEVLDHVVRGAAALARSHLGERDRVGLVSLGGVLRWYEPGLGERHVYRLLDTLIEAQVQAGLTFKSVWRLPARIVPPQALVIALSSLEDERIVLALRNLRGRGRDVAAVQVVREPPEPDSRTGRLAWRLWKLRRVAAAEALASSGIPVATWDPTQPLAVPVEEVWRWRRTARTGSV